jgi:hypothetical protein
MAYKDERIDWVNKAYENSRVMINMVGQVKKAICPVILDVLSLLCVCIL